MKGREVVSNFVSASERLEGREPQAARSDLRVEKGDPASVQENWHSGVGWHTFGHTVGTMLVEIGEHQLTIRDYLLRSNLQATNKYLQATSKTKNKATRIVGRVVGWSGKQEVIRILPDCQ